jgi:hypothetical protein
MSSLSDFLSFWENPNQEDPAGKLVNAYHASEAESKRLRMSMLDFLQPGKDSRGRWVPVFSEDKTGEVAALGLKIDAVEENKKTVSNDIEAFSEITGKPVLSGLINERKALQQRIAFSERHAAALLKKALDRDPHTSPAVLMQRADLKEAYQAQEKAKAETEKPIAALDEKISKARAILDRYA